MTLDDFCGSTFWNYTTVWNTTNPDFTECFQRTVLIWIPCAFLWLFTPLEAYYLLNSDRRQIPWTALNISKIVVNSLLVVLTLVELGFRVFGDQDAEVPLVYFISPFTLFVTFVLSLTFVVWEKRRGIQSSGILFFFWLFLAIAGAITYRSLVSKVFFEDEEMNLASFVIYMIEFPLVFVMFVFSLLADSPPLFTRVESALSQKQCPEENASFVSKLLYTWLDEFAWHGYRNTLEKKDLWSLSHRNTSSGAVPPFEANWNCEVQRATRHTNVSRKARQTTSRIHVEASFTRVILKTYGWNLVFGALLKLVSDLFIFARPLLLQLLIDFMSLDEPIWRGILYSCLLFVAGFVQSIALNLYFGEMFVLGMKMRSAIISTIYKKSLRLSNSARKESTVGEIVNLMSVDAQRVIDFVPYVAMMWSTPLQVALSVYILYEVIGVSAFVGLAVMILLTPVNLYIANVMKVLQEKQMECKDERVKLMTEVLSGIKVLKLYAWEKSFEAQVMKIRLSELSVLKKGGYYDAALSFTWVSAPYLVAFASFASYVLIDENNVLDASKAFVSLSIFNILQIPMSSLPMLLVFLVQAAVSLKRVKKFLCGEELDTDSIQHDPYAVDPIVVESASFSWDKGADAETLSNLDFCVKRDSLVAVVGAVGCGKSSLISALLGDMRKLEGRVNTKGNIAYVSQQAWIQNATFQENVLFGRPLHKKTYDDCIEGCALDPDLCVLPGGDQTEIGEKGINLSGGQKQRVSLARAVYSDADIYLLDDPLSAVDAHVGRHIFEKVIGPNGLLRNKTRLLATHGVTFLPQVDMIVVLRNGTISEMGTYRELLERRGDFADFLVNYLGSGEELPEMDADFEGIKNDLMTKIGSLELERQLSRQLSASRSHVSDGSVTDSLRMVSHQTSINGDVALNKLNTDGSKQQQPDGTTLISGEVIEMGDVKLDVYLYYFKAVGAILALATVVFNVLTQCTSVATNVWLSEWSNDGGRATASQNGTTVDATELRNLRLSVYAALGLLLGLFTLIGSFTMVMGGIRSSRILHADMLRLIMRCPMSFFDTTPLGRIINRFSKDIDVIDNVLVMTIRDWLWCLLQVVATVLIVCVTTPVFIIVVVPTVVCYYFVQRIYICTSRQLMRLESASRSPIYSHFSETLTGVSTIRAFNKQRDFVRQSEEKVDENQMCYFPSVMTNRWLSVRLELVGNVIVLGASLFSVLGKGNVSAGIVGLTISYALSLTEILNYLVRMSGELETNTVAVERLREYANLKTEAPWEMEEAARPASNWPQNGVVVFDSYKTRYREGLELVLRGISCKVLSGEKIGIVGRTGAGKSSLTLSLFRIIEAASGSISIDGVDIATLGLHDLRSKLTIIPQDPVLFSGKLRMNLDPFGEHSDDEIWKALELSHLKVFVASLKSGLEHDVAEGGENLSVGQRQLICLARALLRKTKILILDEATAAVDVETDSLIQETIRKEFAECTVLTIAHRVNTVMDSTRVMVLENGLVKEFDSPSSLLGSEQSLFAAMVREAGHIPALSNGGGDNGQSSSNRV